MKLKVKLIREHEEIKIKMSYKEARNLREQLRSVYKKPNGEVSKLFKLLEDEL